MTKDEQSAPGGPQGQEFQLHETGSDLRSLLAKLECDPGNVDTLEQIGLLLYSNEDTQLQALPFMAQALTGNKITANTPVIANHLVKLCVLNGAYEEALSAYLLSADLLGYSSFAHGNILERLGRFDDALRANFQCREGITQAAMSAPRDENGKVVRILGPSQMMWRHYGEMAGGLDFFLKSRILDPVEDERVILLAPKDLVVSPSMVEYFAEHIEVVFEPSEIERLLALYPNTWIDVNYLTLPDGRVMSMRSRGHIAVQTLWENENRAPLLKLKEEHVERGWDLIARRGVARDDWIVPLHARERGYDEKNPNNPLSIGRYRTCPIEDYFPAIKEITDRGGWVFRIGDPAMRPLEPIDGVIDYANDDELRSDWMDLFLIGSSRFMIGTSSGPQSLAPAFGIPFLGVNNMPVISCPPSRNDMVIHKRFFSRKEGRFLSAREMFQPPMPFVMEPMYLERRDIDVVDNTPEEITEAVLEMMARLDGTAAYGAEDEARQQRYRECTEFYGIGIQARAGRHFLERVPDFV